MNKVNLYSSKEYWINSMDILVSGNIGDVRIKIIGLQREREGKKVGNLTVVLFEAILE